MTKLHGLDVAVLVKRCAARVMLRQLHPDASIPSLGSTDQLEEIVLGAIEEHIPTPYCFSSSPHFPDNLAMDEFATRLIGVCEACLESAEFFLDRAESLEEKGAGASLEEDPARLGSFLKKILKLVYLIQDPEALERKLLASPSRLDVERYYEGLKTARNWADGGSGNLVWGPSLLRSPLDLQWEVESLLRRVDLLNWRRQERSSIPQKRGQRR